MTTTMKFELGRIVMTRGISSLVKNSAQAAGDMILALRRHARGDWGDVCEDDKRLNDDDLKLGNRLLSAYTMDGTKVWVITEADRSSTTVLLPDEY